MRVVMESLSYVSSDGSAAHCPGSKKRNVTVSHLKYLIFCILFQARGFVVCINDSPITSVF